MTTTEELKKELQKIQKRNKRVEADKAWETSWTRRFLVFALTYIVILTFFLVANFPEPYSNALVPSLAFILSTASVSVVKKWWIKQQK